MGVVTTSALILRHQDERERDRLVVALTADHGLMRIRARGTKRSTAKLAGSLEPLTEVILSWADGRSSGLVTGAVIQQRWRVIHGDLVATVSGQWLAELVEHVARPGQQTAQLYELVRNFFVGLTMQISWSLGRRWLELDRVAYQLLELEGFVPRLDHCPKCSRSLTGQKVSYDPLIGFIHADEADAGAQRLESTLLSYLETGQVQSDERSLFRQLHPVLEAMIAHTIDRPLKSQRVLRAVFRQARLSTGGQ